MQNASYNETVSTFSQVYTPITIIYSILWDATNTNQLNKYFKWQIDANMATKPPLQRVERSIEKKKHGHHCCSCQGRCMPFVICSHEILDFFFKVQWDCWFFLKYNEQNQL